MSRDGRFVFGLVRVNSTQIFCSRLFTIPVRNGGAVTCSEVQAFPFHKHDALPPQQSIHYRWSQSYAFTDNSFQHMTWPVLLRLPGISHFPAVRAEASLFSYLPRLPASPCPPLRVPLEDPDWTRNSPLGARSSFFVITVIFNLRNLPGRTPARLPGRNSCSRGLPQPWRRPHAGR